MDLCKLKLILRIYQSLDFCKLKFILRINQNLRKGDEKNTKGYKRDRLKKAVLELSLGRELKILFTSEKTENRLKMQGKIRKKDLSGKKCLFSDFRANFFLS